MGALLYAIEGRSAFSPADPERLRFFRLGPPESVSPELVLTEPGWSIYCLDHTKRAAAFVHLSPEADLADAAFMYERQYRDAQRLILVPFAALDRLAEATPVPRTLVHLFSIGRCGTTLANWILNRIDGVWSLSEPDIYFEMAMRRSELDPELLKRLIASSTRLLFRPPAGRSVHTLCVKHRSQSLFQADLFHAAFPEAKYVFMYRDGESWAQSFFRFAQRLNSPVVGDPEARAFQWRMLSAAADPGYLRGIVDMDSPLGHLEEVAAAAWALHIEEYLRLFRGGTPFLAIRYNELVRDRAGEVGRLLRHCGLSTRSLEHALTAFDRDSQEGTALARDRAAIGFTPENRERFQAAIARHPRIRSADLLLPDIEHPERRV